MRIIEISGENRRETTDHKRVACRAVVERGGEILLSFVPAADYYVLPGGGLEDGETIEECVVREVREETGEVVCPVCEFAVINEYYENFVYESHYFLCETIGQAPRDLTDDEKAAGLVPVWKKASEATAIWARHDDFAGVIEEKRGAYLREHTAFEEYLKIAEISE